MLCTAGVVHIDFVLSWVRNLPPFDDFESGFTAHITTRGEEAKELKQEAGKRARRWVVERSHSWMKCFRRFLVRWDKKPENSLAFLHFVCALNAFRAAGLFG